MGTPQPGSGIGHIPLGQRRADTGGGDDLPADQGGWRDLELHPSLGAPGPEPLGIAAAVAAEAEGWPFDHSPRRELAANHPIEELAGRQAQEPWPGTEDAYLVGTRSPDGEANLIPVSNVTSISTDPQLIVIAIYRAWKTYDNLQTTDAFTVSVPTAEQQNGVWKLGARYSRYDFPDRMT